MTEKIFDDFNTWLENETMPDGKRQVMIAAVQLFSTYGFDGVSTATIAKVAGKSEGTVFKYFKTKRALLNAILEPVITNLIPNYGSSFLNDQLPKNATHDDFVRAAVHNRLVFMYTNKDILKILVTEVMVNEPLLNDLKQQMTPTFQKLFGIFTEITADGPMDALDFFRLIAGQLFFELMRVTKFPEETPYDVDGVAEKISTTMINALAGK